MCMSYDAYRHHACSPKAGSCAPASRFTKSSLGDTMERIQQKMQKNPNWKQVSAIIGAVVVLSFGFFGHDTLYFLSLVAEAVRAFGVLMLLAKVLRERSVKGLSRQTQEIYFVVFLTRICFKLVFEGDLLYPLVDAVAAAATAYIVYLMRAPAGGIVHTYESHADSFRAELVVAPVALLSVALHPTITGSMIWDSLWSFSTFLEAFAMMPQLFVIQKMKQCDQITAHYMVCLGMSRTLECIFWLVAFMFYDMGALWAISWYVIISEAVHTLVIADFFFYYIQAWRIGTRMQLPSF